MEPRRPAVAERGRTAWLGWANLKRFSGRVEEAGNTIFGDISSIGARRPERVGQKLHKEHRYRIPRNSCAHV